MEKFCLGWERCPVEQFTTHYTPHSSNLFLVCDGLVKDVPSSKHLNQNSPIT